MNNPEFDEIGEKMLSRLGLDKVPESAAELSKHMLHIQCLMAIISDAQLLEVIDGNRATTVATLRAIADALEEMHTVRTNVQAH